MSGGQTEQRGLRFVAAEALHRIAAWSIRKPARRKTQNRYALCIFKPDRIGDFVLATGAIRLLLGHFGPKNCLLVISPLVRALAEMEFPDTPKLMVPAFRFSLHPNLIRAAIQPRNQLGALQFERIACLRHQRSRFQNLVLHWMVSEKRHGLINQSGFYLGKDHEFIFSSATAYPEKAREGQCLELEAHRLVAEQTLQREVFEGDITPAFAKIQAKPGNYMLVCPFSSAPLKDYPCDALEAAVAEIQRRFSLPVMLSYSFERQKSSKSIESRWQRRGLAVLPSSAMSFQGYLNSVASAGAVLTVDTATAHIATALDIPTVVILGGGHYGQFGPWRKSPRQEWVTHPLPCFHCHWHCTQLEPYCITRITPESIAEAMSRVLGRA
jgi:ADP-heptose:LPS heptosyltransferase